MSEKKNRRKWRPKEKLRIVLETLQSEGKLSEICRREGLSPTLIYQWRKQLLASAEAVYTPKREAREDRRIELTMQRRRDHHVQGLKRSRHPCLECDIYHPAREGASLPRLTPEGIAMG